MDNSKQILERIKFLIDLQLKESEFRSSASSEAAVYSEFERGVLHAFKSVRAVIRSEERIAKQMEE